MAAHRVLVRSRETGEQREEADSAASLVAAIGAALEAAGTGKVGSLLGRTSLRVLRTAAVKAPLPAGLLARLASGLGIDASQHGAAPGTLRSLWQLATRHLPVEARATAEVGDGVLVAPCDGRLRIWREIPAEGLPMEGRRRVLRELLADEALAAAYERGSALQIELAGFDPHRFYAPSSGLLTRARSLPERRDPQTPPSNRARLCRVLSLAFGDVTVVTGGGSLGGETRLETRPGMVERGAMLGTLGLGGAQVLVLLERGRAVWDADLLDLQEGVRTRVRRGERLAVRREPAPSPGGRP